MARSPKTRENRDMSDITREVVELMDSEAGERPPPDPKDMPEEELVGFIEGALPRLSVENLGRIGEAVRQLRQSKQEEARTTTRQSIEEQLQRSGLSLRDLFPDLLPQPSRRRGESGPVPPKYQGPNGETWSGRGHEPRWLTALVATGRNKEEFLIARDVG
jgi:DNA-binding protein H-NS